MYVLVKGYWWDVADEVHRIRSGDESHAYSLASQFHGSYNK